MVLIIAILCLEIIVLCSIYICVSKNFCRNEPYLSLRDLGQKISRVFSQETTDIKKPKHLLALQDRKRYFYLSARKTGKNDSSGEI